MTKAYDYKETRGHAPSEASVNVGEILRAQAIAYIRDEIRRREEAMEHPRNDFLHYTLKLLERENDEI